MTNLSELGVSKHMFIMPMISQKLYSATIRGVWPILTNTVYNM